MNRIYLTEKQITALYDAIKLIKSVHKDSECRLEIHQDPESGELEIGMMEVSGVNMTDCENMSKPLWQDINKRDNGVHVICEPWWGYKKEPK